MNETDSLHTQGGDLAALQKIKQFDLSSVEDEMSKIYGEG